MTSGAPCELDAKLWRECLKAFDYGPDRKKGACDTQRYRYYDCLKDWNKTSGHEYDYKKFQVHESCSPQALELHECMKVSTFDVERCQPQLLKLKTCSARHDPYVRSALAENEEVALVLQKEPAAVIGGKSRLGQAWNFVTGKS